MILNPQQQAYPPANNNPITQAEKNRGNLYLRNKEIK